jgi:DNA-binding response OmpR family regulator
VSRLIVVDDDATLRRSACRQLVAAGHAVVDFEDPLAALAAVERASAPFDLALLDVRMDPIDGLELATRMRGVDAGLPILFVTASPGDVGDDRVPAGAEVLPKPWTRDRLLAMVDRMARPPRATGA